ncbi:MAG TPA: hypothetical protein VGK38_10180 [Prolixibacteraceae bacterium]|jgi:hypothetical protein
MKTIITISFLVAASLISELSLASGSFRVNVVPTTEGKPLLVISNNSEQKSEISISNSSGEVLYHRATVGERHASNTGFDFSQSEEGDYKVIANIDGISNEQLVTVTSDGIRVGETVRKVEPVFNYNNNLLRVSYQNLSQEKVSLKLYDKENLVWETISNESLSPKKAFDLSELGKGKYEVVLSAGEDVYSYDLTK